MEHARSSSGTSEWTLLCQIEAKKRRLEGSQRPPEPAGPPVDPVMMLDLMQQALVYEDMETVRVLICLVLRREILNDFKIPQYLQALFFQMRGQKGGLFAQVHILPSGCVGLSVS